MEHGLIPAFTPVPRQYERHDGWTPERQRAFIDALADTGSVAAACRTVGMSTVGAYQLRRQPGAEGFRAAWTAALDLGVQRIEDVAMDRALNGVEEPLYSYGELIGTRTRYNDRLLMFMLRNRAPERFADGRAKGLSAMDATKLEQLKQQWRREWEAEQRAGDVTPAEVRASIDRKIEDIRSRLETQWHGEWENLSAETRAAWAHFDTLRTRDLDAMRAAQDLRDRMRWGPRKDWQTTPPGPKTLPPPEPPKTEWRLTDPNFDP